MNIKEHIKKEVRKMADEDGEIHLDKYGDQLETALTTLAHKLLTEQVELLKTFGRDLPKEWLYSEDPFVKGMAYRNRDLMEEIDTIKAKLQAQIKELE